MFLRIYDKQGKPIETLSEDGKTFITEHEVQTPAGDLRPGGRIDTPFGSLEITSTSLQPRGLVLAGKLV